MKIYDEKIHGELNDDDYVIVGHTDNNGDFVEVLVMLSDLRRILKS